ncbi:hypothetical protein VTK56DRAFT_6954 [Thermocarpiscus australiensis]
MYGPGNGGATTSTQDWSQQVLSEAQHAKPLSNTVVNNTFHSSYFLAETVPVKSQNRTVTASTSSSPTPCPRPATVPTFRINCR